MPAALNIDREAVRVLAAAIGQRAAAREMGLSEDTVKSICFRAGDGQRVAVVREAQKTLHPNAPSPVEIVQNAMEDLSTRSRLGFAKASARVAEKLATEEDVEKVLAAAGDAHQWAKTAALAHGWQSGPGAGIQVAVALRIDME